MPDDVSDLVLVMQVRGQLWQKAPSMPRDAAPEHLPVRIVLESVVPIPDLPDRVEIPSGPRAQEAMQVQHPERCGDG